MNDLDTLVKGHLQEILKEVAAQPDVAQEFPQGMQSFPEQMAQLSEYIEFAHEYSVAYESLVALLEGFSFRLSGSAAVKLLEVGLIMGYKTDSPEDAHFDVR